MENSNMPDYVKRMIEEHRELKTRIQKLRKFLDDRPFEDFNDEKLGYMYAQKCAMETYDFILAQRLSIECDEGNCTIDDLNS